MQKLDPAQRNATENNPVTGWWTNESDNRPHPAELLFSIADIQQLLMKSDVPEKMVNIVSHLLWKAERYNIPALKSRIQWYLLGRLGKDREARREYIQVLMNMKSDEDEDDITP